MGWTDLNSIHNPATGTAPPAAWGDAVRDDLQHLAGTTGAQVLTDETTASAAFANIATVGPAVTVVTLTKALVIISAHIYNSGANLTLASVAVSGATTIGASDNFSIAQSGTSGISLSRAQIITGLTPGSNTFTMKYRCTAGTGHFTLRDIVVIPLTV